MSTVYTILYAAQDTNPFGNISINYLIILILIVNFIDITIRPCALHTDSRGVGRRRLRGSAP